MADLGGTMDSTFPGLRRLWICNWNFWYQLVIPANWAYIARRDSEFRPVAEGQDFGRLVEVSSQGSCDTGVWTSRKEFVALISATIFACLLCLRLNHAEVSSYTQRVKYFNHLQSLFLPVDVMLETIFKDFTILVKKVTKINNLAASFEASYGKHQPLERFCMVSFVGGRREGSKLRFFMHFHARGRCLDPHGQRSQYHRGAAKGGGGQVKLQSAAYGSYSLLMFTPPFLGGSEIRISISWVLKGDVHTMFIPCLYHVYSVAQENGCTMASVFWISKHWRKACERVAALQQMREYHDLEPEVFVALFAVK